MEREMEYTLREYCVCMTWLLYTIFYQAASDVMCIHFLHMRMCHEYDIVSSFDKKKKKMSKYIYLFTPHSNEKNVYSYIH